MFLHLVVIKFIPLNKILYVKPISKADFWKSLNNGEEFIFTDNNYIIPMEENAPGEEPKQDEKPPDPPKPNAGWSFLID